MSDTTQTSSEGRAVRTMVIRPDPKQEGQGGTEANAKPWSGGKLSYSDMVERWKARGYSEAGAKGMADNMMRESGGDPTIVRPGSKSIGLFQHEGPRRTALETFAKERGTSATDPDTQIDFADREMRTQYPKLRAQLASTTDRSAAEDQFKRVFERPASVLWGNTRPQTETPDYRYSPYALAEHQGRKDTDIVYMPPQDYLDLAPPMGGKAFTNAGGRSLLDSVDKGEPIEAIPTMDVDVDGATGRVTDQDGRHRALLAQHAGVEAMPVAVKQTGKGNPTEIEGMQGKVLPNTFPKASQMAQPAPRSEATGAQSPGQPAPRSLLGQIGDAIIPRAEAAEANPFDQFDAKPAAQQPAKQNAADSANPFDQFDAKPAEPDGMLMSGLKGAGYGFGKTVLAGQELLGKGLQAAGATGAGDWLVQDARKGLDKIGGEIAPDQAAHPYATGAGELAGGMAVPGGIAGKIGGNALRMGAVGGTLGGLLNPDGRDGADYWSGKALGAAGGAAGGAITGKAGDLLAGMVAPTLRATVHKLMGEGVELTPGQMAGGAMKRAEDAMGSIPLLGSAIRAAQRRSIQTFNRAAINRSLDDIGTKLPPGMDSGHEAIAYAEQRFHDAYNQVIPNMTGIRDPTFVQNLSDVVTRAVGRKLPPEQVAELRHTIQTEILDRFDASGRITGDQAQAIGTRLDEIINPLKRGNVYQQQLAQHVRQADAVLDDMMATHNRTMQAAKERIDAGYAKFKTVQRASTSAGAHPDGTFTPAQLSRSVLARDRSKDKAAFARGDAMMQDLSAAARDVLPQTVPDSGTPERAAFMALLGGAAPFQPHTAAALGLSALPYTAPASRLTNALVNRLGQKPGPTRNALAEILRRAGPALAPAAGSLAAGNMPTMTIHPGDGQ